MIFTNDLKKGTRVLLASGDGATLMDSKKGNTRLAEVNGIYTEIGSIYAHDIELAVIDGEWRAVSKTEAQLKLQKQLRSFGW